MNETRNTQLGVVQPAFSQGHDVDVQTELACQAMDDRRLARAGNTPKQITAPERDAAVGVPALAAQEVAGVTHDELLDTCVKNDGVHRSLRARSHKAPVASVALIGVDVDL